MPFGPHYALIMDSVRKPVDHFLETGIYTGHTGFEDFTQVKDLAISEASIRSSTRALAAKLKRPFIMALTHYRFYEWEADAKNSHPGRTRYKKDKYEEPMFASGVFYTPKRQQLAIMVAPFLLGNAHIKDNSGQTTWEFQVLDLELWKGLLEFVMNDPECRAARGVSLSAP